MCYARGTWICLQKIPAGCLKTKILRAKVSFESMNFGHIRRLRVQVVCLFTSSQRSRGIQTILLFPS